jgi:hypothetical protein
VLNLSFLYFCILMFYTNIQIKTETFKFYIKLIFINMTQSSAREATAPYAPGHRKVFSTKVSLCFLLNQDVLYEFNSIS